MCLRNEAQKKMASKHSKSISDKVKKIMKEGVRRNTHKPVSKTNKRRKVSQKQAVAIAYKMAGKSRKKRDSSGKRILG
jgi:hypothetical protein